MATNEIGHITNIDKHHAVPLSTATKVGGPALSTLHPMKRYFCKGNAFNYLTNIYLFPVCRII